MMLRILASLFLILSVTASMAQEAPRLKSTAVVLVEDPELRASVERRLVEIARRNDYDAVTSYDFAPDVHDIDDPGFIDVLEQQGVHTVLMLRPAAVGEGSSLESVRASVAPETFAQMRVFASWISQVDPDNLIAVVHMAIYAINDGRVELLSAGAVWLDEDVESQDEGIERLLKLVLYNVDAVRPAIRRHLGLPPLE